MIISQNTCLLQLREDFPYYQPSKLPLNFIKVQARILVQKAGMASPTATDQNGNTALGF